MKPLALISRLSFSFCFPKLEMIFQFSKKTFGHFLKIRGPKLFIIRQKYFEPKNIFGHGS